MLLMEIKDLASRVKFVEDVMDLFQLMVIEQRLSSKAVDSPQYMVRVQGVRSV